MGFLFLSAPVFLHGSDAELENFRDFDCYARLAAEPIAQVFEDTGEWTNAELLQHLKDNPGDVLEGEMEALLSQRGSAAMAELLSEFEAATPETTYYRTLALILSRIPDQDRNLAFARELKEYAEQTSRSYPEHDVIAAMIRALAAEQSPDAVEALSNYPEMRNIDVALRIEARVALNRLGKPHLEAESEDRLVVSQKLQDKSLSREETAAQEILTALLNHEMLGEAASLELTECDRADHRSRKLSGSVLGADAKWSVTVGEETAGGVPVLYTIECGLTCSGEWIALMRKQEGQWLAVYWRKITP